MNKDKAEKILQRIFKIEHFHDEQWSAIEKILKGERVLLIEKTGFGKSLCFQFPALLFKGITVVFSPLIALMRDQVKKTKCSWNSSQMYKQRTNSGRKQPNNCRSISR